jgi:CheY-like chemotaxis protein/DNA-directed RNA polymerase specialized sigma24 family protein
MQSADSEIARNLPSLRRYTRLLLGSQETGDQCVRIALEALLAEPALLEAEGSSVRQGLYRLFHDVWGRVPTGLPKDADIASRPGLEAHVQGLPAAERRILLLTTVEGFSLDEAAAILRIERDEAETLLKSAHADLAAQAATTVLIIEDEPVIALDLVGIVKRAGHRVVGTAATRREAVHLARTRRPGIILADIQLGDGSSGIDAADEITAEQDVPIVFVTAFPERLLTGIGREPTYLVTKPFDPDILRITISQAIISTTAPKVVRAAG